MSTPDMTPILEDLAAGRIDAAEASRRIEALKGGAASPAADQPTTPPRAEQPAASARPTPPPSATGSSRWREYARETFSRVRDQQQRTGGSAADGPTLDTGGVETVSIRAVGRRVRVVGDARVATASVEGQHVLRRTGSVLEITSEGEIGPSFDGWSVLRPPRSFEDVRNLGLGKELLVRVNPVLVVDVELTAGSLTTEDVRLLGKVRVTAGGAKVTGFREAHDVLVQAGQATLTGTVTTGRSRVRGESGSLVVNLGDDSNVTVHAESQLGRVAWGGRHSGAGDEVVMGNGSARLDVGVVMGHATVKVGSDPTPEAGGDHASTTNASTPNGSTTDSSTREDR